MCAISAFVPHDSTVNIICVWGVWAFLHKLFILTTVGFVGIIPTVIHAVALPLQTHTHSVGTLEGIDVTHFAEFRRCG